LHNRANKKAFKKEYSGVGAHHYAQEKTNSISQELCIFAQDKRKE